MTEINTKLILEALLLSSGQPLRIESLLEAFDDWQKPTREEIYTALEELRHDYSSRAIELKELASGYCVQTRPQYSVWITRLLVEKPGKYSRALLETLAIIAYQQPVTRADIENIRGVAVNSTILKTLLEREWVRIAGHRDVPGKPAVYATTRQFLDYFNLKDLEELPSLLQPSHETL